jgi:hypothetical protein
MLGAMFGFKYTVHKWSQLISAYFKFPNSLLMFLYKAI